MGFIRQISPFKNLLWNVQKPVDMLKLCEIAGIVSFCILMSSTSIFVYFYKMNSFIYKVRICKCYVGNMRSTEITDVGTVYCSFSKVNVVA